MSAELTPAGGVAERGAGAQDGPAPHAGAAATVDVRPVAGRAEMKAFIHLPWRIYAGDPMWVPPLLHDVKRVLDRKKHPFHRHADVEYFLAWRAGRVVGRIAAVVNRQFIEFHGERTGTFGFFEAIDDEAVAAALLREAEAWLRARGMERLLGPFNFSTNDELGSPGVLIDGFDTPPMVMMSHTPPYYGRLLEAAGLVKSKDLLAYRVDTNEPPPRLVRGVQRLQHDEAVTIRSLDMKRFAAEVRIIQDIYRSAWERNWGFVPMTDAEFEHMAEQLKPVANPRLCAIAEVRGEPVGFALALPDYNQILRRVNGRLFPFGLLKLLWYRRTIDAARVITLGIKPGFRSRGLDAMLILHLNREGAQAGFQRGECSWILEDNWDMRRLVERVGLTAYKTYRVFEKPLA
jgi:GNAT superfamily N-acetyltransferase